MRHLLVLLAAGAVLAAAEKPVVPRDAMKVVEQSFSNRLVKLSTDTALDIVGEPRGIYLPGYGVVISADVNLISIVLSPFRPALSREEVVKLHQRKLARLPMLRSAMRQVMVDAANQLDTVPGDERIVVVVSLYNFKYEDVDGLPGQILMEATRKQLVGFGPKALDDAIAAKLKTQEFDHAAR
ncbi:MAG: hypothetical protein IT160_01595 [Bryobacterales bacterium]|nr:hypothetical protein [Bryobacterales bacterium]